MRLLGTNSLNVDDTLAMPVLSSSGKIILNSGVVLTENYINKLKQSGIHKVFIEDDRFNDVEYMQPLDLKIQNSATLAIKEAYTALHKGKAVDEYVLKDVAKNIVDYIRDCKDRGVSILSISAVDDYIIEHTINVSILTAFIGNRMNFNYIQLCDLVTGALIHDMGRENAPVENQEHVQIGFDVFRKCRGLSLHSSIVCYEHHENFDGSGYPRKLKGTAISEFSRVVRIADFYDDMLRGSENYNIPIMPHQAFEYVLAASGKYLDPAIVEIFRDTIVFYPNGCTVLLNNGLKGVVVKQNPGSPQRPIVRVCNDTSVIGEINLLQSLTLSIKDVIVV